VVLHQRRILLGGVRPNYGADYRFVIESPPAEVQWAGKRGRLVSTARRTRTAWPPGAGRLLDAAARLHVVDAGVYVPGLTDGTRERPELVLAQAELRPRRRPRARGMRYVGRFGNDYRYRWEPDRRALSTTPWTSWKFAPRFSTDGTSWTRLPAAHAAAQVEPAPGIAGWRGSSRRADV